MKIKALRLKLVILTIFFVNSCGTTGILFDPDFFVFDTDKQGITNEDGFTVYYSDEQITDYACLHKDKIKELAEILKRARIPKQYKQKILDEAAKLDAIKPTE
jgi:hypothetical protein